VARRNLDAVRKDVLDALRAFVPRDVACTAAGVSAEEFEEWLEAGHAARSGKVREFALAVAQLEATAEVQLIARMAKASQKGDVKATQWLLERGRPERWARKSISPRVVAAPGGVARPPLAGEGEGEDWDLDNVRPIRPGG
jgi:hypothetical protein